MPDIFHQVWLIGVRDAVGNESRSPLFTQLKICNFVSKLQAFLLLPGRVEIVVFDDLEVDSLLCVVNHLIVQNTCKHWTRQGVL